MNAVQKSIRRVGIATPTAGRWNRPICHTCTDFLLASFPFRQSRIDVRLAASCNSILSTTVQVKTAGKLKLRTRQCTIVRTHLHTL